MGCQGDGAGGDWGRRRCGEHKVNVGSQQLSDHVTQRCHFNSTLTQLLHESLPALQQLHRLRGAAVQGKMVSHTWQEVSCNKGKNIRDKSVLSVVDGCKAQHLLYFFLKLKVKTQNVGKNVKIIFLTGLVRYFQRWGHSWPTGLNGGVATPGSHLDPLHGAIYCARALVPFNNITAGGVLVALPRQREASVGINCSGNGNRFLVWENNKSAETKHLFEFLGQTVQRQRVRVVQLWKIIPVLCFCAMRTQKIKFYILVHWKKLSVFPCTPC